MVLDLGSFPEDGVAGGPCASCRYLDGTKHGEGRGCKTKNEVEEDRETTDLLVMMKLNLWAYHFDARDSNDLENLRFHRIKLSKM